MLFIWNLAEVVAVAATGGFPAPAAVLDISDIIQHLNHDKSSSISQLIKGNGEISKNYSNILMEQQHCLKSKDLLVVVLLLIIL